MHCGLVWALLPQFEHCDAAIDVDGGALGAVRCGRLAAGDLEGAERMFQRALKGCEKTLGSEHDETLEYKESLAVFFRESGRLDKRVPALEENLAVRRKQANEKPSSGSASALSAIGKALGDCDRHDEAIGHLIESAEMCRRLMEDGGEDLEDVHMGRPMVASLASTLKRLADVYEQVGKEKQAAQARAEAQALAGEENA